MKDMKKMLLVVGAVALASQLYIDLFFSDFRISFGIILFSIFLFVFQELNIVQLGIFTAIAVFSLRASVYAIGIGTYGEAMAIYFPEMFFYMFYGIFFAALSEKNPNFNLNKLFFSLVVCDYFANLIEIYIRGKGAFLTFDLQIMAGLFLVAIVRSSIVWIVLNGLKYYRMLLLKEDHEERYKKLLWMTSRLKTELYWMEKNMDDIEKVMADAYGLFEKITTDQERESWAQGAVTIAKDVHEIKKEYGLVVRGVEEITENKLRDKGMHFKDILNILEESLKNEIKHRNPKIQLTFQLGSNFYTTKHYYLMSILRNIIMNAIEALSDLKDTGKVSFVHEERDEEHIFQVIDNGCGIKEKDIKYIFSPGFSTKINYNTGQINRGLGLSVVQDIVEDRLKGKIHVDSVEGKGSIFEIHIFKEILEVEE